MRRPPLRLADAMKQERVMVSIGDEAEHGKDVAARLIDAHEAERTRIAGELHDDIGQRVAALTIDLDVLGKALPLPTTEARTRIRVLSDGMLQLAKDLQALAHRLRPSSLEYLGVVSASASFCRDVSSQQNVDIAFTDEAIPDALPNHVALSVFRVLQEAVTNAVKHAGVRHVAVTLRGSPEEIRLEIVDAGTGFDVDAVLCARALGLVGMQERVRLIGGELVIQSRPGTGTSIRVRVPLSRSDLSLAAP
jgi:signal transduction histidine kinase